MQQIENKPDWLNDSLSSAWEHAREAIRRDWEQTKHELHLGGHELNQTIDDTLGQAVGEATIPPIDVANAPKVIGDWTVLEGPIAFGYMARSYYGPRFPKWSREVEEILAADWKRGTLTWDKVKDYVRHGYESPHQ